MFGNNDDESGASSVNISNSVLGTRLRKMLMADDIQPGSAASYELCKEIFLYHPLGRKLAEAPIAMAQSQPRTIMVPDSPEELVKEQFQKQWKMDGIDGIIFNTVRTSRIYGISAVAILAKDFKSEDPIPPEQLADLELSYNVFDPMNAAGSLVLDQDPNSLDFQKQNHITVQGQTYHRSRTVVVMNEEPIYLAYTPSAYGYTGRPVYQRALFPLKSYLRTMISNDMIATKLGLLIAKLKAPGSIVDQFMKGVAAIKRSILKEAGTGNVINIDTEESIETLNMMNVDGAGTFARSNILKDVATASDMPAVIINQETMVEGFGEGTEDAKNIARWVDGERIKMDPLYDFFDKITMRRAWNQEFYETIQAQCPEYKNVSFNQAFYRWSNSFKTEWPSLLTEPDSEKSKTEDVKLKAVISLLEVLLPAVDPKNKAMAIQWACDNFNSLKMLFTDPLHLDPDTLMDFLEEQKNQADQAAKAAQQPPGGEGEDGEGGEGGGPKPAQPENLN